MWARQVQRVLPAFAKGIIVIACAGGTPPLQPAGTAELRICQPDAIHGHPRLTELLSAPRRHQARNAFLRRIGNGES